jgi:hypothetical protein
MFKSIAVWALLALAPLGSATAKDVAGAWQLQEIRTADAKVLKFSNANQYLFTKGHFSIIRVEGDKPRSTESWTTMTPDQVVDTYVKQFTASGGTYDLKGETLTMKTTIAKNPNIMTRGDWISYAVKFSGDTMTLTAESTNEGAVKNPMSMTLVRLD